MENLQSMIDYDVLIIGDGPAGMSAAIFTASEGLETLVIGEEIGGQSSHTNLIENYYGFPQGISGTELAIKAKDQALKFGVKFEDRKVVQVKSFMEQDRLFYDVYVKDLNDDYGSNYIVTSVLVANGLIYRPLKCKGDDLPCVHYLPTQDDLEKMKNKSVAVVGGGNSAGQAALHLVNDLNCRVALIIKGNSINKDMSQYLVDEILNHPNIEILTEFDLAEVSMKGDRVRVIGNCDCNTLVDFVAVYIGMMPEESFLPSSVKLDEKGFVEVDFRDYSTTAKGIFAAGDCHQNARNRIAASVGEGSIVARSIHEYVDQWNKPIKINQSYQMLSNFPTPGGNYLESENEYQRKEDICYKVKQQIDMYA